MGSLTVRSGSASQVFDESRTVCIGRSSRSDIAISNPNVSRDHVEVRNEGGTWVLHDVGSSQGTWRDGEQVRTVEIQGTVRICLGKEGRGELIVLETQAVSPSDRSRPGGTVGEVDLHAATDLGRGVGGGSAGTGGSGGTGGNTVIVGSQAPHRPGGHLRDQEIDAGTVITGAEIRLECGGRTYTFTPGRQVAIGRDPSCDVVSANPTVSRRHAVLDHDGAGWILSALQPTSGMFSQGTAVQQMAIDRPVAVSLGPHETGERLVLVAGPRRQPPPTTPPQSQSGSGSGKKVLLGLAIGAVVLFMMLLIFIIGATLWLRRT